MRCGVTVRPQGAGVLFVTETAAHDNDTVKHAAERPAIVSCPSRDKHKSFIGDS